MRADELRPGDVVAGKYRVRVLLGRSRGTLVEAFHTEFDQRVALRIVSPLQSDPKAVERFHREARTLAKLEGEHVARILDVGRLPDGSFYLVRQFLEGTSLATHVRLHGALPLAQAALFTLQAAEAVAETHAHGILLRELMSEHLFVTKRVGGSLVVKLVDFGTAKVMRGAAAPVPGSEQSTTALLGTTPYSSPEVARRARHDVRADVYSLGAVLYEMLTGRPPFVEEGGRLLMAIQGEEPVAARSIRPEVPPELDAIVHRALEKDPQARFPTVHALASALAAFAPAEGKVIAERIVQIAATARRSPTSGDGGDGIESLDADDLVEEEPGEDTTADRQPLDRDLGADPASARLDHATRADTPRAREPLARAGAAFRAGDTAHLGAAVGPPPAPSPTAPVGSGLPSVGSIAGRPVFAGAAEGMEVVQPPPSERRVNAGHDSEPPTTIATSGSLLGPPLALDPRSRARRDEAVPAAPTAGGPFAARPPVVMAAPHARTTASHRAAIWSVVGAMVLLPALLVVFLVRGRASDVPDVGDGGLLVVQVTGGTCTLDVDGTRQGRGAALRLALAPGVHTVVCTTETGAVATRSVTVAARATATVTFDL